MEKTGKECYDAKMMIILLLACASGVESDASDSHIRIFTGTCDYVQFPEHIQIDPGATYILQMCSGANCRFADYTVDEVGLIRPQDACPEGYTWKITEIKEG